MSIMITMIRLKKTNMKPDQMNSTNFLLGVRVRVMDFVRNMKAMNKKFIRSWTKRNNIKVIEKGGVIQLIKNKLGKGVSPRRVFYR